MGRGESGEVLGHFEATGIRPEFLQEAESRGISLSPKLFQPAFKLDEA